MGSFVGDFVGLDTEGLREGSTGDGLVEGLTGDGLTVGSVNEGDTLGPTVVKRSQHTHHIYVSPEAQKVIC